MLPKGLEGKTTDPWGLPPGMGALGLRVFWWPLRSACRTATLSEHPAPLGWRSTGWSYRENVRQPGARGSSGPWDNSISRGQRFPTIPLFPPTLSHCALWLLCHYWGVSILGALGGIRTGKECKPAIVCGHFRIRRLPLSTCRRTVFEDLAIIVPSVLAVRCSPSSA